MTMNLLPIERPIRCGATLSAAILLIGCSPVSTDEAELIASSAPTFEDSITAEVADELQLRSLDLTATAEFRLVLNDSTELRGEGLRIRAGQPWEITNFTLESSGATFAADRGTFDPASQSFTMEGRVRALRE